MWDRHKIDRMTRQARFSWVDQAKLNQVGGWRIRDDVFVRVSLVTHRATVSIFQGEVARCAMEVRFAHESGRV